MLVAIIWSWAAHHRFAVWLGELPPVVGQKYGDDCKASRQKATAHRGRRLAKSFYASTEAKNSNHHAKMLAAYALLRDPGVTGLYYADLDARAAGAGYGSRDEAGVRRR